MDLKQGLGRLKAQPGSSLHFFFCEKGADDKPVVLLDSKAVAKDAEKEVLARAKSKTLARGTMHIDEAGDLCVTPRGPCPSGLQRGIEKAAKHASVAHYFKTVKLNGAEAATEETARSGGSGPYGTPIPAQATESLGYSTPPRTTANPYGTPVPAQIPESVGYSTPPRTPSNPYGTPIPATSTDLQGEGAGDQVPPRRSPDNPGTQNASAASTNSYTTPNLETGYPKRTKDGANGKMYPDPLRKGSTMAALLDLKEKTQRELAALSRQPQADTSKIEELTGRLDKIDAQMEKEIRKQAASGVSPKALEPEYQGEDQKVGWKAWPGGKAPTPGETDEEVAARTGLPLDEVQRRRRNAETATTVRKNFDATDRTNNNMAVGPDGLVRDDYGNLVSDRTEFVADPETGDLVGFGALPGPSGKMVPDAQGNLVPQEIRTHHSSPLAGGDVAMAGSITVERGEVTRVSNISGHYKPEVAEMLQFLEGLLRKGALLDKEWAGPDGQPLTGDARALYEATVKVQNKLKKRALRGDDVTNDLAGIEKARAMLVKMGCGPTNKINPNAKVEFLEVKEGMTGLDIKLAADQVANNPATVESFLQGGDNKKAQQAKANVQADLKADRRFQKAGDRAERSAAKPTPKPTADAARRSMEKNLTDMEGLLADADEGKYNLGPSERKEIAASIAALKRKLAEVTEPTRDDLKTMLRAVLEIKARLSGAAPQARPVRDAEGEESLEGPVDSTLLAYAEKRAESAARKEEEDEDEDEPEGTEDVNDLLAYAEKRS
jgi:hypothetical protein